MTYLTLQQNFDKKQQIEQKNYQFKVFNRWGNLVYEKDSYLNEWFGQDMDGNTLSDGTYFVIFEGCGAKFNTYVDLRRN